MPITELGKLEIVDLREVWANEPQDFTPWLAENIELLGESLNLELRMVQQEARVGSFSLDILATDETGAMVAIENQLETTDHSHLGQLLTYSAGYNVRTLIWVTPHFKDEHRATLEWLNRWAPEEIRIYGVEVRAVRIGTSLTAPEFIPVVVPNEWPKGNGGRLNPDGVKRREFYQPLVDRLREAGFTDIHRATSGWIQSFPSKVSGLTYNADIGNNPRVFLSMSDRELKNRVFDAMRSDRAQMEQTEKALGLECDSKTEINWKTAPGNISVSRKGAADNLTDEVRDWMYDYLIKFSEVLASQVDTILSANSDQA